MPLHYRNHQGTQARFSPHAYAILLHAIIATTAAAIAVIAVIAAAPGKSRIRPVLAVRTSRRRLIIIHQQMTRK